MSSSPTILAVSVASRSAGAARACTRPAQRVTVTGCAFPRTILISRTPRHTARDGCDREKTGDVAGVRSARGGGRGRAGGDGSKRGRPLTRHAETRGISDSRRGASASYPTAANACPPRGVLPALVILRDLGGTGRDPRGRRRESDERDPEINDRMSIRGIRLAQRLDATCAIGIPPRRLRACRAASSEIMQR